MLLKGKKVQLNLSDGRNYLSDLKCKVNDSVIIDFKSNKVTKCLPLKDESKVIVFAGKHSGFRGAIKKINPERKMAELQFKDKKINVLIKQIMVVE
jgi:ribosomal protein S4E